MEAVGAVAAQQRAAAIAARVAALSPRPAAPSFDVLLARATTTQGHSHVHAAGATTPPPELEAYGNGRIPPAALAPIGVGGHRLWGPAAAAFQAMRSAAAADGVTIGVTDSYRSYDEQVELAGRKGLYSQGGLAATPGRSNHGWGMALDLDLDDRAQAWMRRRGAEFGFVEAVPREPWHWEYRG